MLNRALFRANAVARKYIYSSRPIARALYGGWFSPYPAISFWELGSLAMRSALSPHLRDGMRVLEIGTGPYATLAIWARSRFRLDITATEVDAELAQWASRNVSNNGAEVNVFCTDMFAHLKGPFDAIWFVPPFTPQATFEAQLAQSGPADADLEKKLRLRTCGGPRGTELIERFLSGVGKYLSASGKAFLSLNRIHVPTDAVRTLLSGSGLRCTREVRPAMSPYGVLILERAD